MKCKALSVRSDSLLSAKMTAVLCLLLLIAAQLASSWPLSACPEDTGSEIVLNGLEQDVLVSPPVSARRGVQLQTCRLRPGATITRSIVFQASNLVYGAQQNKILLPILGWNIILNNSSNPDTCTLLGGRSNICCVMYYYE